MRPIQTLVSSVFLLAALIGTAYSDDAADWLTAPNERAARAIEDKLIAGSNSRALWMIGSMYLIKDGKIFNPSRGMELVSKAADLGDADAQFVIARSYETGEYLQKSLILAESYYRKSSAQKHPKAMYNLALLLRSGDANAHRSEIVSLMRESSLQGQSYAMFALGTFYIRGDIVPSDYIEAYRWLNLAASMGDQNARQLRNELEGRMSSAQVAEGQKRSAETKIVGPR